MFVIVQLSQIREERQRMRNVEELIDYLKHLTPEQSDKLIRQMPKLLSSVEELLQPVPQKAS